MRVITGTARGTKLKPVPGDSTRPTTDMVKEALFSAIQFDIEGRTALDLFAGTGQLGIEALSRGATRAVFVDSDKTAVSVIRDNLEKTHFTERADVRMTDYRAAIKSFPPRTFGVIFIDPPYASGQLLRALETISKVDISLENGIIVCESSAEERLPAEIGRLKRLKVYAHGITSITLYRCEAAPPEAGSPDAGSQAED